jgi:hypothetical protein
MAGVVSILLVEARCQAATAGEAVTMCHRVATIGGKSGCPCPPAGGGDR